MSSCKMDTRNLDYVHHKQSRLPLSNMVRCFDRYNDNYIFNTMSTVSTNTVKLEKAKRCLFGAPKQDEEAMKWLAEELEKTRSAQIEKWNFDFNEDGPLRTSYTPRSTAFRWAPTYPPARPQKRKIFDHHQNESSNFYFKPIEPADRVEIENLCITEQPNQQQKQETADIQPVVQHKKQKLITDFMIQKKRPVSVNKEGKQKLERSSSCNIVS